MEFTQLEQGLLDNYQHYFPLTDRPFDQIARRLGLSETQVLQQTKTLLKKGVISRIGPVFSADSVGANVLAVMSVPPIELECVAAIISAFDDVTHCYEREHTFNLWFVVSSDCDKSLQLALSVIEEKAKYKLISLPMLHDYQIERGSRLNFGQPPELKNKNVVSLKASRQATACFKLPTEIEQKVIKLIQSGIPVCESPYERLGDRIGMTGRELTGVIQLMHHHGILSRWGVVLRHYELGLVSNAMVVWDIPDGELDTVAENIAEVNAVSMCFKRPRVLPEWRYNLFSQVHGQAESSVYEEVQNMVERFGIKEGKYEVLFCSKRFKGLKNQLKQVNSNILLASVVGLNKFEQ